MSRLHMFSDDDEVLSGRREPARPFSPSEVTWHRFTVVDEDQRALENEVAALEDRIADIEDRMGMLDRIDSTRAFRTVDTLEGLSSRLSAASDDLRRKL